MGKLVSILPTMIERTNKQKNSLRLVNHLYSEYLLDHEQFLDWIVSSFHGCEVDRIPVWLLMVQMHWKEIWQYRHRGRRIAASMLHHLQTVRATLRWPFISQSMLTM